jgi:hypothetical protein
MKARRKFAPYGSKVQIVGDHLAEIATQEATLLEPIRFYGRLKAYKVKLSKEDKVIYLPSPKIYVEDVPPSALWMGRMKKTFRRAPKSYRPFLREQVDEIVQLEQEAKDLPRTHQLDYPARGVSTRRVEGTRGTRRGRNPAPPDLFGFDQTPNPNLAISRFRVKNAAQVKKDYERDLFDTRLRFKDIFLLNQAIRADKLEELDEKLAGEQTSVAQTWDVFSRLNSIYKPVKQAVEFSSVVDRDYIAGGIDWSEKTKQSVLSWVDSRSKGRGDDKAARDRAVSLADGEYGGFISLLGRVNDLLNHPTKTKFTTGQNEYERLFEAKTAKEFAAYVYVATEKLANTIHVLSSLFAMMENIYLMPTSSEGKPAFSSRIRTATESLRRASQFVPTDTSAPEPASKKSRVDVKAYTDEEAQAFSRFFPSVNLDEFVVQAQQAGLSLNDVLQALHDHEKYLAILPLGKQVEKLVSRIETLKKKFKASTEKDILTWVSDNTTPEMAIEDSYVHLVDGTDYEYTGDTVGMWFDLLKGIRTLYPSLRPYILPRTRVKEQDALLRDPRSALSLIIDVQTQNRELARSLIYIGENNFLETYDSDIAGQTERVVGSLIRAVDDYISFIEREYDANEQLGYHSPGHTPSFMTSASVQPPASPDTLPDEVPPPPDGPTTYISDPTSLAEPTIPPVSPTGLPPIEVLEDADDEPPVEIPTITESDAGRNWWIEVGKARDAMTGDYARNTDADAARDQFRSHFSAGGSGTSNVFDTPVNPRFSTYAQAGRIARADTYAPMNTSFWKDPKIAEPVAMQMVSYPLSFDRGDLLSFYRYALGGGIGTAPTMRKGKYPHRKVVEMLHGRLKEISSRKAGGFTDASIPQYVWDQADEMERLLSDYLNNSPYPEMMKAASYAPDSCQNAGPPMPPYKPPGKYPWQRYPSRDASARTPNPSQVDRQGRRTRNHPIYGLIADGVDVATGEMGFEDAFDDLMRSFDPTIPEHTAISDLSDGDEATAVGRTPNQGGMDTSRMPNFADMDDPRDSNPMRRWGSASETVYPYLPLADIELLTPLITAMGVSDVAMSDRGFMGAYRRARGNPAGLASVSREQGHPDWYWWNRREGFNARHIGQVTDKKKNGSTEALWVDGKRFGLETMPSRRHLALIAWAWTPHDRRFHQWINSNRKVLLAMNKQLTSGRKPKHKTKRTPNAKSGLSFKDQIQKLAGVQPAQLAGVQPANPVLREDERVLAVLDALGYRYGQNMPGVWVHGTPIPDTAPPIVVSRKRVEFSPTREACVSSVQRGGFYKPSERMAMVTDGVVRQLFDRDIWSAIDWTSPPAMGEAARCWVPNPRPCYPTAYDEGWLVPSTANLRELLIPPKKESYLRALSIPEGVDVSVISPAEWKEYLWDKFNIPEELRGETPRNRNPKNGRKKKKSRATVQNIHALLDSMQKEANKLGTPMFAVVELQNGSDGASMTVLSKQKGSAVNNARGAHSWWEYNKGINPCHDRKESKKKKRTGNPPPKQQKLIYGDRLAGILQEFDPFYLSDRRGFPLFDSRPIHRVIQPEAIYRVSKRPYGMRLDHEMRSADTSMIIPPTSVTHREFLDKIYAPYHISQSSVEPLVDEDIYRGDNVSGNALSPHHVINIAEVWPDMSGNIAHPRPPAQMFLFPSIQASRDFSNSRSVEDAFTVASSTAGAPPFPWDKIMDADHLSAEELILLNDYYDDFRQATGIDIGPEPDPVFTLPFEGQPNQAIQRVWAKARQRNGEVRPTPSSLNNRTSHHGKKKK